MINIQLLQLVHSTVLEDVIHDAGPLLEHVAEGDGRVAMHVGLVAHGADGSLAGVVLVV